MKPLLVLFHLGPNVISILLSAISIKDKEYICDEGQIAMEGDYGTVVVHDRLEIDKLANQAALIASDEFAAATRHTESLSVSGLGNKAIDSCVQFLWYYICDSFGPYTLLVTPCQFHF
ncbi:uncharacterized protein LOC142552638 isoform X4 [Primulina tabacum]|uniref:uncharacterized protein LOC142552638 isoform X4 n=1 Tax=Primulina tabacum TaxID=48773 RepID=UPI003F59026F